MSVDDLTGRAFGPYRLDAVLGLGAMGAVYRAHQTALERDVAVKVLPSVMAARPDYLARFNREAKIAASLEHPHIVPLYDYGTDDGMSYVVMRLLNGGTLAERLNARALSRGPLPSLSETSQLLRQIASALDYAHRKAVVHRDIKPNNIMFDDEGTAYVVDFGIARLMNVSTSITGEQTVFGTPHYMPPEQWRDQTLTPESDQYALAVVIYSMVSGQPPFDAPTPHALMYKHFHEDAPPPSSLNPDLPTEVDSVIERALRKEPNERYKTAGEFARAFEAAIAGVPPRSTDFFTFPLPEASTDFTQPRLALVPPPQPDRPASRSAPEPVQSPVLPPPPVASYPAHAQPAPAVPPPRKADRRERPVSSLLAGVGLGLALLGLVVCGAGAFVASRLGVFDRAPVETQPVTEPLLVLTAVDETPVEDVDDDPQPTALPMPGDTRLPNIGPIPPSSGTPIAAANIGGMAEAASMSHGTLPVRGVTYSADGQFVITGAADGGLYLWDLAGNPRGQSSSSGGVVYSLAASPDGRWLASGHEDGTVRLWEAATLSQSAVLSGHNGPVRSVDFSPDSRYVASAGEDQTLRLWDVSTQAVYRQFDGLAQRALATAFSPGSTRVAGAGDGGVTRVWDVGSGSVVTTLADAGEVRGIAFSPTGNQLATAGADGRVRVWDAESGALQTTMTGHGSTVWTLAYSPDGTLLATGGQDNTARIWDAATGEELTALHGHGGWVLGVAFSPDGSQLATGSGDGSARLWDVAAG